MTTKTKITAEQHEAQRMAVNLAQVATLQRTLHEVADEGKDVMLKCAVMAFGLIYDDIERDYILNNNVERFEEARDQLGGLLQSAAHAENVELKAKVGACPNCLTSPTACHSIEITIKASENIEVISLIDVKAIDKTIEEIRAEA